MYVPKIRKLNDSQIQQLKDKYEITQLVLSLPLIYFSDPIIKSYNLLNNELIKPGDLIMAQGHTTPFCIVEK